MGIVTYEGIVELGQLRLKDDVRLPDKTRVYVVVPENEISEAARICSPRLAHPDQMEDFKMEVIEESSNAGV